MRTNTISLYMMAAAVVTLMSCDKEPMEEMSEKMSLTIEFFSADAMMKASAPYRDEDTIKDVTLFIDRIDMSTGKAEPYAQYYTDTDCVEVNLEFPANKTYEYSLRAYANFGVILYEPACVEFKDCFDNSMKMHGEAIVDKGFFNAGDFLICLRRYVGKVTVNSIKLDCDNGFEGPLTLDAIYVANAGKDNSAYPASFYNPEGVVKSTGMDQYLYEKLDGTVLVNGDKYSRQHHFYGFNGVTSDNPTAIIIETTYEGRKMYYRIDVDFAENYYTVYDFVIVGTGLEAPYGAKVEFEKPSILAHTSYYMAENWTTETKEVFSEEEYVVTTITIVVS